MYEQPNEHTRVCALPIEKFPSGCRVCKDQDGQKGISAIICEGSTCNEICPNFEHCTKAGVSLGLHLEKVKE